MGNHALIYGASGISGWAIVNAILNGYPSKDAFSRVTAMVNRPLTREMALWPDDPRLQIVSGVDLVKGTQEDLEKQIKEKVKDVETVTQVYFYSYKQIDDPDSECKTNEAMLERAVTAIDHLSSKLSYVLLPTGTKIYGCQMLDKFPFANELPLKETLPPIPEPYLSQLFYYNQIDCLKRISKGKNWSWCEVRPDNIIGFVPNNNAYCLAQTLALYLSLYRSIEGEGVKCPFPGTEKSWVNQYNESPQDMVAHFSIHASLNSEKTASQSFNVGGQEDSWSGKWPIICDYFGLEGTGPEEGSPQPGAYIDAHKKEWEVLEKKHDLKKGSVDSDITHPGFQYFIMTMFDFDRQMSMEASHKVGYTEEVGTKDTWTTAFDLIPLTFGLPHGQRGANLNLPLRILPLGDAITWGWQPGQENGTDGYRARLLRELVRARYHSVDFVGTQHSGFMDNDNNEGHPGLTISQLQGVMKVGLQMRPNVVLLHVGTNDLARAESTEERWSDAPKRLARLLDEVLDVCPDAVVLVAKLIQAEKTQIRANIKAFNDAVPSVVTQKLQQGFKLSVVDHSVVGPSELVDSLHPSYSGYFRMGDIWLEAIKTVSTQGLITPPIAVQYQT
ncbi:hypothetical protein G6011_07740 [Alternaria panax]|uniref:SGNH hydrolase-type esterase domain-containing protein n=1 Tax=Alternaria panax TaxID=48097 RepID=A0AAD4F8W3_9PLEO|nr:hypothetical protein G6011_07740 [Alternaria panax]